MPRGADHTDTAAIPLLAHPNSPARPREFRCVAEQGVAGRITIFPCNPRLAPAFHSSSSQRAGRHRPPGGQRRRRPGLGTPSASDRHPMIAAAPNLDGTPHPRRYAGGLCSDPARPRRSGEMLVTRFACCLWRTVRSGVAWRRMRGGAVAVDDIRDESKAPSGSPSEA
jgi:hypothetical protein